MKTIVINNLNDGINVKNDPSALPEGGVVDAVGFDLSKEGVLEVCQGLAANDVAALVPSGEKQWMAKVYLGTDLYVLVTTADGLYANGVLVDADFRGRFKALPFLNNIFLVNGSLARRFDGTAAFRWGIQAPTSVPTIAAGSYLEKAIDPLTALTEWIANQSDCTVSVPTTGSNLVTNGTFTGSGASWTFDTDPWTYNANAMDKDADGVDPLYQTIGHTIGRKYRVTFTISNLSSGGVLVSLGGEDGVYVGANGTYNQIIIPTTTGALTFTPTEHSRFTIDTVTVYESLSKEAEASNGMAINVAASTLGSTYIEGSLDLTEFTTGEVSSEKDYIRFWLRVDNVLNLQSMTLIFDAGDGTFETNLFSYTINGTEGLQMLGMGSTAETLAEETTSSSITEQVSTYFEKDQFGNLIYEGKEKTVEHFTNVITKNPVSTHIDPVLTDQTLAFWRRSQVFRLKDDTWIAMKIPKSLFLQTGDEGLLWSDVVATKIEVLATSVGAVNVYIDGLKLVGGSDLMGDYWFVYTWGRSDGSTVVHESAPSRNTTTKQMNIIGPVSFDRHPIVYSNRPLSSDPQVDCGVLYGLGGGLVDFWAIAEIFDNTTITDTLYGLGESTAQRKLVSKRSEPAPPGTDIVMLYNKIWMVGDDRYPTLLRSSDILDDGTVSPESWPPRNGYELDGNHGVLNSIRVLNQALSVKGKFGEWLVVINDPTDYLQVSAKRISDKGLIGQDAVVELPDAHIYPTNGGFVQSNGQQVGYILPEIEPLIDVGMEKAIGVNAGLLSYFTYSSSLVGTRTAKVDLYRGQPRFSNLNDILFECLFYDKINNLVYGIYNGEVYIIDSGYVNSSEPSEELFAYLKSKVYRPGGCVAWTRVQFHHNTGGTWFRFEVYIDGELRNSFPFMSTSRTRANLRFGPHSGYDFQFVITGDYKSFAKIYFPIGVYHSG